MGKKCKKKVVWKQLKLLEENSLSTQSKDADCSYSDAVSGSYQNRYESNWPNKQCLGDGDTSYVNSVENTPYNNKRPNYKHNRSNRNNGYKWRRRFDRPQEDEEKEYFKEDDAGRIVQDEEYTKIQTPRQEVIFKKRSLERRKEVDLVSVNYDGIVLEEGEYNSKVIEMMQTTVPYDDSAMYMTDIGSNQTLAGMVVQQLYPGGPMVSIPVHYGQYVSPTLIPGDPALLTLDPSFTRIISADEMEDVSNILPMQLDANGHPITVQVKVDENGVPIEIEPRGFHVFEGNIEEQQYFISEESQHEPNVEEDTMVKIEADGENSKSCDTPTESTEVSQPKEIEKDLKEIEECSSDSQYATMSESSSPNTPASELSDPSDIPDQSMQSKLLDDQPCSADQIKNDAKQKSSTDIDEKHLPMKQNLVKCGQNQEKKKVPSPDLPVRPKQKSVENRNLKLSKVTELKSMSRKQRKKEAKLLKKQNKTESSSITTPPVIIREKTSPSLFTLNSTANSKFATKSLRNSLAFLNSPEFSIQQYLKYQGSLRNRNNPILNNTDSNNTMTSPLDGFGHIDVSYSKVSRNNIIQCQLRKESLAETPKLVLPSNPNDLLHELGRMNPEEVNHIDESISLPTIPEYKVQSGDPEIVNINSKQVKLNSPDICTENVDIITVSDKLESNSLPDKVDLKTTSPFKDQICEPSTEIIIQNTATIIEEELVLINNGDKNCEITSKLKYNFVNTEDISVKQENNQTKSTNNSETTLEHTTITEFERETNPIEDITATCLSESSEHNVDNLIDKVTTYNCEDKDSSSETSEVVHSIELSTVEQTLELDDKVNDKSECQGININGVEFVSEEQANIEVVLSKQGYVMVPVLTPYYSPTVFYGYPLVMPDNGEEQGKYNRKKKRRFKKKNNENQQQFHDVNALPGNPYIATDDGFVIPVDPSQACHIHNCHYIPTGYPQQGVIDEGFVSAEHTPFLPSYIPDPSETLNPESEFEVFGSLQNHEREEIAEVLKELPKPDSTESGDSGVSESEEYNKKAETHDIMSNKSEAKKDHNTSKLKSKKENKKNHKQKQKFSKGHKPFMIIEEPDFSHPNSYPFNNRSNVPDLKKVSLRNDRKSKKNKKSQKDKGKNKKSNITPTNISIEDKQDAGINVSNYMSDKNDLSVIDYCNNTDEGSTLHNDCDEHNSDNSFDYVLKENLSSSSTIEPDVLENDNVIESGNSFERVERFEKDPSNCNETGKNISLTNSDSDTINIMEAVCPNKSHMKNYASVDKYENYMVDEYSYTHIDESKLTNIHENSDIDDNISSSSSIEEKSQKSINDADGYSGNYKNNNTNEEITVSSSTECSGILPVSSSENLTSRVNENNSTDVINNPAEVDKISDVCSRLRLYTLSAFHVSSDTLSTIEEANEECIEMQNNTFDKKDFVHVSSKIYRPFSKPNIIESVDSFISHNEYQITSDLTGNGDDYVEDATFINGAFNNLSLKQFCHIDQENMKTDKELNCELDNDYGNDRNVSQKDFDIQLTLEERIQNNEIKSSSEFLPTGTQLEHNYDSSNTTDDLSYSNNLKDDFERKGQEIGKICQSLGVAKAVEKWIQEVTPAKAFISYSESQNVVLFEELREDVTGVREIKTEFEQNSKNVESNPLIASRNSTNDDERVAECPRELNIKLYHSPIASDLDFDYETSVDLDKCDPSMFSKYYQLGVIVDTPFSSSSSSRDNSSNRTYVDVPSQRFVTDEVDFQDNLYHSKGTDDVMASVPRSEKLSRLCSQKSCSRKAACNTLQERKEIFSKETDCASLFSSGIGSSLASTPLTSPSHPSPMPKEVGEKWFPLKNESTQCVIL